MATNYAKAYIWYTLMEAIKNPYGVAGLMGNLFAESSLNPLCFTGANTANFMDGEDYAARINTGAYSKDQFAHDGIAFGLAQWQYYTRKEALYDFAKNRGIGAIDVQVGFLLKELPAYKTVWNTLQTAKSVKEASDIVLEKYEKPSNQSDKIKELRAKYGEQYFQELYRQPSTSSKFVTTTIDRVNIRSGNGKEYGIVSQIANKGSRYPWIATAENGWHAIKLAKSVAWVSGEFTEVIE